MRGENELRAAAARRAAADPFALLCPGRRLVLSLPRRGAAAPVHIGSDANPSPGNPHASPGLDSASAGRLPGSSGVCGGSSAGGTMPEASPGNHLSTGRLPTSNGVCGKSSAGVSEPSRIYHSAEQPASPALRPERAAGQSADPGDPAPAGSSGATCGPAPASAAASGAACHGGGTSVERPEDAQAAGNGSAASPTCDANGDAPGGGWERHRLENEGGASANGTADAARAPRFTAAVLDAPQAAAAAGARDCAVFIVPQVCCQGPHPCCAVRACKPGAGKSARQALLWQLVLFALSCSRLCKQ